MNVLQHHNAERAQETSMESLWWTLGIIAIVFYTLWVAGAFKKKSGQSVQDEKK